MSGGHWDYAGARIRNELGEISIDPEVSRRFPRLARVLRNIGYVIYEIEHDLDWDFSGDSHIGDDVAFENSCLADLRSV